MAATDARHKEYWLGQIEKISPEDVANDFERAFARLILTKLEGYQSNYGRPLSIDLDFVVAALEAWDELDHNSC